MTPRNFVYLAIAAALSVLFAVVSFASNNQWGTGKAAGDKLLPTMASDASQVATIEVRQGDNAVVLERAAAAGVSRTVATIQSIPQGAHAAGRPRRSRPHRGQDAQARPIRGCSSSKTRPKRRRKSRLVRLLGAKGNVMGEVVIGKKRLDLLGTGKSGTYVRKPGDPQTWLANAELDASIAAKDWLKTSVFTSDAAKVSRITIEIPGEQPLRIEREAPPPPRTQRCEGGVPPAAPSCSSWVFPRRIRS